MTYLYINNNATMLNQSCISFYFEFSTQIERFNKLLRIIKKSLIDLEKGIKGLVVMSSDLEETFNCIYDARVPPLWGKVSPYHN